MTIQVDLNTSIQFAGALTESTECLITQAGQSAVTTTFAKLQKFMPLTAALLQETYNAK